MKGESNKKNKREIKSGVTVGYPYIFLLIPKWSVSLSRNLKTRFLSILNSFIHKTHLNLVLYIEYEHIGKMMEDERCAVENGARARGK